MKTKILMLGLLLSSCELFNPTEFKVQDELKVSVDKFYALGEDRGYSLPKDNLIISLRKGLRAECKCLGRTTWETGDITANPQVRVLIDEDYFHDSDSARIYFTIFHELGHGVLRRKAHTNGASIMNPACRSWVITEAILDELYRGNEIR